MGDFYTCIDLYIDSLLKFMNTRQENQEGINAVMLDFTHVMIDMMQANTPFLNLFWYNSPTLILMVA
ncbi:putative inner membrane protein [Shigella dysenteriae]|nr:putative inner membrane protein [Shigella dysenteriae]